MEEIDVAEVLREVRKQYIKYDEGYEDTDNFEKDVYEAIKKEYGDEPDKFFVAMVGMDFMKTGLRTDLQDEIKDNWNSLMKRVMG